MGKYKDHRERRGKRHGNDLGANSDQAQEPSYFQGSSWETSDPVGAEVLWFNRSKGFGFVRLSDGSEVYLHIRVLEAAGGQDLSAGIYLKVTVEDGLRGRQVAKILDIGEQNPSAAVGEREAGNSVVEGADQSESEGMVKWYNPEKGFGFIAPDSGENDVFVHATALARSGLSVLEEGQKVLFQAGQGKKGMEVRTIRLA